MCSLTQARPIVTSVAAAAGLLGSIACSAAMVLPVLGVVGAGAAGAGASMAGMGARPTTTGPLAGLLAALVEHGPAILAASTLAIALAVALRRPLAAIPVLAAGAVLYWGMYLQPTLPAMYVSIAHGLAAWLVISAWLLVPWRTARNYSKP